MLIQTFSSCEDLIAARERFRFSLESLLRPVNGGDRLHPTIERAKAYIHENFNRRIYLSSIATALVVSPNYLSRLFRRETGVTLTAYVQRVRLDRAMRLLEFGRDAPA
jgi:AraC-like DNA-binding protein